MKIKLPLLLICFCFMFGLNAQNRPSTQASNIVITNKTATSATISWTKGNGSKRVVFVENPSGKAAAPFDNITYSASSNWSSKGTKIGTSNYYCVYNGSGNSVTLKNLTPNARYAVRISEYNGTAGGEQYLTTIVSGNPVSFTTPELSTPPSVQASNIVITNKTATSATISWTKGNGSKRVVFVENPSGKAAAPFNNITYSASSNWSLKGTKIGTSNYYCVYNGSGNSVTLENLTPNARYAVRISEYNGTAGGEQYLTTIVSGNPVSFTTPELSTPPSVQATNIVITNKTATSATISWTKGNGSKRVVFVENPSGKAAAPFNNITYSASSNWSLKGTKIGTSNYYCVYNGSGNSVTLKNLTPNSRYAVRISEYNGVAGGEQYLTTIVSGNPISFMTLASTLKSTEESRAIEQDFDEALPVCLFPNPTSGKFTVSSNKEIDESMNISVTNLGGSIVRKVTTQQNNYEVDLTGLNSGVYIVTVNVKGAISVNKMIMK